MAILSTISLTESQGIQTWAGRVELFYLYIKLVLCRDNEIHPSSKRRQFFYIAFNVVKLKKKSIQIFIPDSFENYICHILTHWLKTRELNSA